jgi:hypothetical protein
MTQSEHRATGGGVVDVGGLGSPSLVGLDDGSTLGDALGGDDSTDDGVALGDLLGFVDGTPLAPALGS